MSKRATYRVNADSWTHLRDLLTTPVEFNTDSATLRGRHDSYPDAGRLGGPEGATFRGHRAAGAITYVIYSYNTPIAYRITTANAQTGEHTSRWIIPDVRYSVTTSKHQGKTRTAISQLVA